MSRPQKSAQFPRAILHVDGDAFFASCEVASRPWLRGRPVVTGREKGIASSMSYEAKARGVTRAMRLSDIRRLVPDVVIISSDYEAYRFYAERMYEIVRAHSLRVEEYSIDECFADLTGLAEKQGTTYLEIGRKIKEDLALSLGLSFSVGVSVNKVLAKIASKTHKPGGLTVIPPDHIEEHLATVPIGKVWGIGSATTIAMRKKGIVTALDLARKDRDFVQEFFSRPVVEIYEELRGASVKELGSDVNSGFGSSSHEREDPQSIQSTETFRPPSKDPARVFAELSHNIEGATERLRGLGLYAARASFFLKTQSFEYTGSELDFLHPVSTPGPILEAIRRVWGSVFRPGLLYRATGVRLSELTPSDARTGTLFDLDLSARRGEKVYESIDRLHARYGYQAIFLGSSMKAMNDPDRNIFAVRETKHKFGLPYLGEAK